VKPDNTLNEKEREKIGLDTQLRFNYQTNWAITYILDKVIKNQEFVIFMEYHEDVITADSCQITDNIEFEFYQIKTTQTNFTLENICKYDASSKSNSVLGKMILGVENKSFKKHVKKLCLLSTSNINFDEKINVMGAAKFLKDLKQDEITKIFNYLKIELNEIDMGYKDIICFEKANLPFENSESTTKGKILEFIEKKYGPVSSKVSSIYTALWDDLRIKHDFLLSYDNWDECVQKRGLRSDEVTSILATNINLGIETDLKNFIEKFLNKYDDDIFTPIKINLINEYYLHLITNRSADIFNQIQNLRQKIVLPDNIYDPSSYLEKIDHFDMLINSNISLKGFNQMKVVSTYEVLREIYEKLTKKS